jgi:predicted transcriptional regulator
MLKPQGYIHIFGEFGTKEFDTVTCGHCNKITRVKPGTGCTVYILESLVVNPTTGLQEIIHREEPGAACRCCMRSVCLSCDKLGTCTPLMKRIEEMEARGRMLKSLGL